MRYELNTTGKGRKCGLFPLFGCYFSKVIPLFQGICQQHRFATPLQWSMPAGSALKLLETAFIDHSSQKLQLPTLCCQPVFYSRYMYIDCV